MQVLYAVQYLLLYAISVRDKALNSMLALQAEIARYSELCAGRDISDDSSNNRKGQLRV